MNTLINPSSISECEARQICSKYAIEMEMDSRTTSQYVTELLVYIEAIEIAEGEEALEYELNRFGTTENNEQRTSSANGDTYIRRRTPYLAA